MLKKLLSNKKSTGNIAAFLSTLVIVSASSMVKSDANSYYIRTVFDEGSFGLISQVISDKTAETGEPLERKTDVDFSAILNYKKVYKGGDGTPGSSLIANIVTANKVNSEESEEENAKANAIKEIYKEFTSANDANKGLLFTFPGLNSQIDSRITYVGMSADAARAELVANNLTKGINDALAFIKTYSKTQYVGGDGLRHVVAQLARITSQFPDKSSDTFNTGKLAGGKGFSVYHISDKNMTINGASKTVAEELIPVNGLRYSDYLAITTTDEDTGKVVYGYFPWKMEKGYYPNGPLADYVGSEYAAIAKGGGTDKDGKKEQYKENKFITWGQMIIQAGVNADIRGTQSVNVAEDSMTLIGQGLGADLTGTIASVRSLLNLAPIQELILNMGSRGVTHHYGVMTQDMYNTAKNVYVLILSVSLLALGALIVKMIHQKMISTTNIVAKTSLMEGLQDIVFVAVMLALFPSIFELLLELNYWIVKTFSFSHNYLQAYGITGAKVLGLESLAGFMVSSMFLSIDAYINTTYLVRAIVVSFLFAISPMMTISYAWGPMQKKLYFSYMRELVGNIFMQSFHAITMTFFAGYNTTNMSAMEAIASTYCFIPITQLFRSLVIGSQGGFSEQLGGKLAGQLTNTAMGMHKASVSMRQSTELNDMISKNNKNSSLVNGFTQSAVLAADLLSSANMQNLANGELGKNNMSRTNDAKTKTSGSSGGGLKGVVKAAAPSIMANAAGAAASGVMEGSNRHNLGEMQMKHSMENIGVGLAQAGVGLGISSYDAGTGGSMVGAGMSNVESAAGKYGEGSSNSTTGVWNYGIAKAADTASTLGTMSARMHGKDYMKAQSRAAIEQQKLDNLAEQQREKVESKGLDYDQNNIKNYGYTGLTNHMGITKENGGQYGPNDKAPIIKVEAHEYKNDNGSITFDVNALKDASSDHSLVRLAQLAANRINPNDKEYQETLKEAKAQHGASTTMQPIYNEKEKTVTMFVNQMSAHGYSIDKEGKTYAESSVMKPNMNKGENSNS